MNVHVDDQDLTIEEEMLRSVREQRDDHDVTFGVIVRNYQNQGMLAASARKCDDGIDVFKAVFIEHAMFMDIPILMDVYKGCPEGDPPVFEFNPRYYDH